jgi:hypothetical protein
MPHYYGDNHPNGETSCFAYNAAIRRLGGEVWFEFWLLPTWVGQDCVAPDHPHAPDPEAYARAMVAYCRASRDATGHPPEMVGVQKEICQHADLVPGMVKALRRALDAEGFQAVRIHMANASTVSRSPAYIHAHRHDSEAWALIDYAAVNMYDGVRVYHDTDRFREPLDTFRAGTADRPFLSPELSINAQELQHPGWAVALSAAQLVHDNLTRMDAKAVCWCWTLLDVEQPSYGWTRSLCVPDWRDGGTPVPSSGLFRMFRAFSRFVRRGMVRVGVISGHEDLMASAFVAAAGARTLVLVNRSIVPRRVDLGAWADLPRWELTGAGDANRGVDPCRDGLVDLPPGAILTGTDLEPCRLPADFRSP